MTYTAEWLTIVNRALSLIGNPMLVKLDEGTDTASYCNVLLPIAVEAVYSSLQRPDLAKWAELPRLQDVNSGEYSYAYKKPEALVRIIDTLPHDAQWHMGVDAIYSDSSPLSIFYVSLPKAPDDIPVYARELVVLKLAAQLAKPVAHDDSILATLESLYSSELSKAISLAPKYRNQPVWGEDMYL